MAKAKSATESCPMEIGLNVLSGKWRLLLLWRISQGTVRFNALQRAAEGITTKILTQQLRELEELGMIHRQVYPEIPPRVEYTLTELGESIRPVLAVLCDWGRSYQQAGPS